ncbi:MAG: glucan endo-1,6-beta-glucosidase, partial [Bacteroidota bacterium]
MVCSFLRFGFFHVLLLSFLLISGGCKKTDASLPPDPPPVTGLGPVQVWLTKGDKSTLFNKEVDLSYKASGTTTWPVIMIDTTVNYQTIEGFGAALTGSSAYLLNHLSSSSLRQTVLRRLFDPDAGIGISFLRLSIGSSDFSTNYFSYNDLVAGDTDYTLQHFSLSQDTVDVIPVLKDILQIAPTVTLLGSPWSPPAWMKSNGNLIGG